MIDIESVTVNYGGAHALADISVEIPHGARFAVLGHNGAGKTTLLRTMAGLTPATRGRVTIGGRIVHPPASGVARAGVRFVPESGNVFGDLTVGENLQAAVVRIGRAKRAERVAWALEVFPLLQRLVKRRAEQLSGGERQTLAVAVGLMVQPKVLLLDEPSLGLSPATAATLIAAIRDASAAYDMTIVLAEQKLALARDLCETGCWLDAGAVTDRGSLDDIAAALSRRQYVKS